MKYVSVSVRSSKRSFVYLFFNKSINAEVKSGCRNLLFSFFFAEIDFWRDLTPCIIDGDVYMLCDSV